MKRRWQRWMLPLFALTFIVALTGCEDPWVNGYYWHHHHHHYRYYDYQHRHGDHHDGHGYWQHRDRDGDFDGH